MVKFSSKKSENGKKKHLTLQHENGKILLYKSENGKIKHLTLQHETGKILL